MIDAYRRWRYRKLHADTRAICWAMRGGCRNYAYPISRAAGISPSRTYRALTRLEQEGLVCTGWEDELYPRRRWYQLTEQGKREITPQVVRSS